MSVLAAIMGSLGGLAEVGLGIADRVKSNKIMKTPLDQWKKQMGHEDFEDPQSYIDYLGLTRTAQRQQIPGLETMKGDVAATQATTLSGAQNLDAASSAAVLLGSEQNRMRALRSIGLDAARYSDQQRLNYYNAVNQGAQYDIMGYEYNSWLPAQMKLNQAETYRGMGNQGMISGLDQLGAAGVNYANMQAQNQWYNQMYPNAGMGAPTYFPAQGMNNIGQLGQQQVQPAVNLGYDPYYGMSNPAPITKLPG